MGTLLVPLPGHYKFVSTAHMTLKPLYTKEVELWTPYQVAYTCIYPTGQEADNELNLV